MIRPGSLIRFLKDTDKVDPAYWDLVGLVIDVRVEASWLYGSETRCDVLVDDRIIKGCCEGYEIEEIEYEAQ